MADFLPLCHLPGIFLNAAVSVTPACIALTATLCGASSILSCLHADSIAALARDIAP